MNSEKLNSWLALAANLGVLLGIVFLAAEIQQSNRIAKATTEIEIRSNYGVMNQALYGDSGVAALFIKAESESGELTAEEQLRLRAWLTQAINQWIAIEIAYQNDMAPRETFEVIFDDQRLYIDSYPGTRPIFRSVVTSYPAVADTEALRSLDKLLQEKGY